MEQQNKESKQLGLKKKEIWPLWSGKNETKIGAAKEKTQFSLKLF